MKILYGITKSNFGGAQRYVFDMATEAQKLGHDVSVLCGGEGPLVLKLKENGIRTISLPYLQRDISLVDEFRSFHFIFRTLVKEGPDVFHTNSSKMGGLGNLAGRLAGIKKIVFTCHGWEFNAPRPGWQKFVIKLFSWMVVFFSHQTICVSEKAAKDVSGLPFTRRKLSVIHNGISDFDLLDQASARKELEIGEGEFVVGTLSELHPVKGLDVLLDAWEKFTRKTEAKLVMLGDGEIRTRLETYAELLDIKDKVRFVGFKQDARKYLKAFDVFCLPSRSECLPYTLLEAGIASRPVIATSVGGVPEVIENGLSGALVSPEDSEALFSTLLLFSEDQVLRDRLGSALHKTIKEKFSLGKMVEETLKVYK